MIGYDAHTSLVKVLKFSRFSAFSILNTVKYEKQMQQRVFGLSMAKGKLFWWKICSWLHEAQRTYRSCGKFLFQSTTQFHTIRKAIDSDSILNTNRFTFYWICHRKIVIYELSCGFYFIWISDKRKRICVFCALSETREIYIVNRTVCQQLIETIIKIVILFTVIIKTKTCFLQLISND